MLAVALIAVGALAATASARTECFRAQDIVLTEWRTQIELEEDLPKFHRDVPVRIPVDCRTSAPLVPHNEQQAIASIDVALPMDFKIAALRGETFNPEYEGYYGPSVMSDLIDVFSKAWKLDGQAFCRKLNAADLPEHESTCFTKLVKRWREQYRAPRP